MQFTIMGTGDNPQAMQEMRMMFNSLFQGVCQLKYARLDSVHPEDADVFCCGLSQTTWATQVLPREKILVTEPRFNKDFFRMVRDLPTHAVIGVPHSNSFRTNMFIQGLRNMGHTTQQYLPILPTQPIEVQKNRLAQAEILIGTKAYLEDYLRPERGFVQVLRPDVRIIRGERVTKPESICHLIDWLQEHYIQQIQQHIGEAGCHADLAKMPQLSQVEKQSQRAEQELHRITAEILEKGRDPETALSATEIHRRILPPFQNLSQLADQLSSNT